MKKEAKPRKSWLFLGIVFLFIVQIQVSFAQSHLELTPSLSISEEYDDNLFLDSTDEKSDYLTMASPGFSFSLVSQNIELGLEYVPTFVEYADKNEYDTVRHSGTLTFGQDLTEYLRLDVTDTWLRSEEPLETVEEVEGERRTRNTYERNTGSASLRYVFGMENALTIGYRHSLLENEENQDDDVDDGRIQNPFVTVTYHFNVKNQIELDYGFTRADFWRDDVPQDGVLTGDDYTGHSAGIRYIYSFTPHTTGSLGYSLATRNFDVFVLDDTTENQDYKVHEGSIGFEHAFAPDLSLSAGAGYFSQDYVNASETSPDEPRHDETGYTYNAMLNKQFERGSFSIGGNGGWDEAYLEAERRGFTRYWSANTTLEYQILESVNSYAGGSYRRDRDENDRDWENLRGNCGLTWSCLRWFSLSLDYSYAERNDDEDLDDYRVKRVTLILTASRLYRW